MEFEKQLKVTETGIPGLKVLDLSVHGDSRGWFKENWQRAKVTALGIPDCRWVQNNISFNDNRGVTRGIHAEPWNKLISVASGRIFGAWVDLRQGSKTFGQVYSCELDPSKAIYVPRGIGNSYQALEDGTVYTYLVDAHWSAELKKTYTYINLADSELSIQWPISLNNATLSDADLHHPWLKDVTPMPPKRTLVTGCSGQLGHAVHALAEKCEIARWFDFCDLPDFDISDNKCVDAVNWDQYATVINCGAYTAVDKAETFEGRRAAWAANATGPANLAHVCEEHDITLVHISSDYVFDGARKLHKEDEPFSPLSVYGQSKAAGDLAVSCCPKHYILRSSWVIGEGRNFVKTMMALSDRCADPGDKLNEISVVNDQLGRLTFTKSMAEAIFWLLGYREGNAEPSQQAAYGTYNCTGVGRIASWYEIATRVFELTNKNGDAVRPVSTSQYYANVNKPIATRPSHSTLDITKLEDTGYKMPDWEFCLSEYIYAQKDVLAGRR